jgi:hypothetical protein
MIRYPQFFIVGAPKAGTTSLDQYLAQYPDIFVPAVKEIHYFGSDLLQKQRKNTRLTEDDYLAHFEGIAEQKIAGESSVLYLKSASAPTEIRDFCPDARIIIMLRHPVELMHALHSQLLSQGDEDEEDFIAALALEPKRKAGSSLPKMVIVPDDGLFYRETAALGTQVQRYLDVFPREQVHFVFFEDFVADTAGELVKVRRFLVLSDNNKEIDLSARNPNSVSRYKSLARVLQHPPSWMVAVSKAVAPRSLLVRFRDQLRQYNNIPARRAPLSPEIMVRLTVEFDHEITLLEQLTGRDLTAWRHRGRAPL